MYIYDRSFSKYQPLGNFRYPDPFLRGFLGEAPTTSSSCSPACDSTVATPAFSAAEQRKLTNLLSPKESDQAIKWNRERHPAKSGVRFEDIIKDLNRYVDFGLIRAAIEKS